MTSSNSSTNNQTSSRSTRGCCGGWSEGGKWSGFNIFAMVLGFILFWPIGLFILFWIMAGRSVKALPGFIREFANKLTDFFGGSGNHSKSSASDNSVFNDYQEAQFDRIRELKEEIKERANRFHDYRDNAKRRADEEEFNRFMSDVPGRSDS